MKGKVTAQLTHHSCNIPLRQSSGLTEIWWQTENAKEQFLKTKFYLPNLTEEPEIYQDQLFYFLSYFFLAMKEEEQAQVDGEWTKDVLDRKVTGNRSQESWGRGIAKAWEQQRCFTDTSGQTFKATR